MKLLFLLSLLFLIGGCTTVMHVPGPESETPRVAGKKKIELFSVVGSSNTLDFEPLTSNPDADHDIKLDTSAAFWIGGAYGLSENFEVGIKTFIFAPVLNVKYQFLGDSLENRQKEFAASIYTRIGISGNSTNSIGGTGTPVTDPDFEPILGGALYFYSLGTSFGYQLSKELMCYSAIAYSTYSGNETVTRKNSSNEAEDQKYSIRGSSLFFSVGGEYQQSRWKYLFDVNVGKFEWDRFVDSTQYGASAKVSYFF